MGVFDKIKNLFYEEEIVEVPKENLKEEIKKVERVEEQKDEMDDIISERDLVKSETNFKFPIIFEDEDFVEIKKEPKQENVSRVNHKDYSNYKKPTLDREVIREVIEKPKKFTPSPVISPVYGVLDKNYKKDEINDGKHSLEKTKELVINFDTIRQKAYGTLTDDIENELISKTNKIDEIEKEIDNILEENNLLSDLEEESTEVTKVEIESDEYNYEDFGVEYKITEEKEDIKEKAKKKKSTSKDLLIDDYLNNDINEKKEEKIESEEEKEIELTEDLFNLIDSMYDR